MSNSQNHTQNHNQNQNKECNCTTPCQEKRTRCEVWTRVMGYHRPVQNFNIGKKSEHYSRKHFSETVTANNNFTKKFA